MDSLTHISKIETADVAELEEIQMLLTIVRTIAPEGAHQEKVNNAILVKLERQGICTYHEYIVIIFKVTQFGKGLLINDIDQNIRIIALL